MVPRLVFICLFSIFAFNAAAQPTLPDISGTADKGIVILTWNCQYSGIKSISVLRSADSLNNYNKIGAVKKLEKGVQAFVDGHPARGKNYYKLNIIFSSNLKWSSNFCGVKVENAPLESSLSLLPSNDSLQKFIVTQKPEKQTDSKKGGKNQPIISIEKPDTAKTAPKCRISISFEMDTLQVDAKQWLDTGAQHADERHKIIISFDDPDANPSTLTKSRFLSTDTSSGHVRINLPEDVKTHHYSIRFFNQQNKMTLEVPKLNTANIIMDKRNFQRKGVYKFVLRKDVTELETGYITIW